MTTLYLVPTASVAGHTVQPTVALVEEFEIANVKPAPEPTTYTRETKIDVPPSFSIAKYTGFGTPPPSEGTMTSKHAYVFDDVDCTGNRMWSSGALLWSTIARPLVTWISVPAPLKFAQPPFGGRLPFGYVKLSDRSTVAKAGAALRASNAAIVASRFIMGLLSAA